MFLNSFNIDIAYFDISPPSIITVWIALDDMNKDENNGPLQYVVGSHLWGKMERTVGVASQFYNKKNPKALMLAAGNLEIFGPAFHFGKYIFFLPIFCSVKLLIIKS